MNRGALCLGAQKMSSIIAGYQMLNVGRQALGNLRLKVQFASSSDPFLMFVLV